MFLLSALQIRPSSIPESINALTIGCLQVLRVAHPFPEPLIARVPLKPQFVAFGIKDSAQIVCASRQWIDKGSSRRQTPRAFVYEPWLARFKSKRLTALATGDGPLSWHTTSVASLVRLQSSRQPRRSPAP